MKPMIGLAAVALLSGCLAFAPGPMAPPPSATVGVAPPPPPASGSVAACRSAAEAQALAVRGVASVQPVPGPGGGVASENVMLDVSRGAQAFTVRCAYQVATGEARIMTL
jgi:hypothetical protein